MKRVVTLHDQLVMVVKCVYRFLLSLQLQVLEVSNPSNYPVTVQPVFLHHYTRPNAIIDMLSELNHDDIQDIDFSQSANSFAFLNKHKDTFSIDSSITSSVLPPQSDTHHIVVAFTPKVEQTASTLLLIRNNLTVLDYVVLQGQGSLGTFTIDDIQPNSDPLVFEFTNSMLEKCQGTLSIMCIVLLWRYRTACMYMYMYLVLVYNSVWPTCIVQFQVVIHVQVHVHVLVYNTVWPIVQFHVVIHVHVHVLVYNSVWPIVQFHVVIHVQVHVLVYNSVWLIVQFQAV